MANGTQGARRPVLEVVEVIELESWHLEEEEGRSTEDEYPPPRSSFVRMRDAVDAVQPVLDVVASLVRSGRLTAAQAVLIDELLRSPRNPRVTAALRDVRARLARGEGDGAHQRAARAR